MSDKSNHEPFQDVVVCDKDQFENLVLDHYEELRIAIRTKMPIWLRDTMEPEDLLQETMISAFDKIDQFCGKTEKSLVSWLKTILENKLCEAIRFNTRKKRGGTGRRVRTIADESSNSILRLMEIVPEGEQSPSQALAVNEIQMAVASGIAMLPANQREAIRLHYMRGLSLEETSSSMDVSPGVLRGLLRRGKAHLKSELKNSSL